MARLLALTGALIAIALACASPATAAHVQCGDVITQDTTLDNDLVCAGDGLTVEAPDISLRLAGHSIAGSGSGTGVTLVWPGGVAIQGGTISNFGDGVYTDGGRGTSFREMRFEGNRVGVRCAYAPECLIEDSVFRDNDIGIRIASADGGDPQPTVIRRNLVTNNGVGIRLTGEAAIVADNRVDANHTDGISSDYGRPVTIMRNLVSHNGDEGIRIFFGVSATVTGNRVVGNAGSGVGVHGGFGEGTEATIANNRAARNGRDGVLVDGVSVTTTVQHNDTARNGDDGIGIDVSDCCGDENVVRANKAYFNADLGIEAAPGTTDGGGNRARHNGNPAQCVGIVCR